MVSCSNTLFCSLPDHRTMNPCPVYERKSKTIYLFFVCILGNTTEYHQIATGRNQARLCYVTSTDYGQNWSKLTDLTNGVIGDEICNWATFAVGPGHGIQMKSGRLIIPAYVYYIHCRCFPFLFPLIVRPHALSFYSDDCGVTWQMGGKIPMKSCECEMAEIIDHADRSHLYCNARSTCGHRVEALSESSGAAFDNPHVAQNSWSPVMAARVACWASLCPSHRMKRRRAQMIAWHSQTQKHGYSIPIQLIKRKGRILEFTWINHPWKRLAGADRGSSIRVPVDILIWHSVRSDLPASWSVERKVRLRK